MRPPSASEISRIQQAYRGSYVYVAIEVWRDPDESDFTSDNTDAAGFVVSTGEGGKRSVATYQGRYDMVRSQGQEEEEYGGQETSVVLFEFTFVEDLDLDIRTSDELHVDGRVFQVSDPGGANSMAIQRKVKAVEILNGSTNDE